MGHIDKYFEEVLTSFSDIKMWKEKCLGTKSKFRQGQILMLAFKIVLQSLHHGNYEQFSFTRGFRVHRKHVKK